MNHLFVCFHSFSCKLWLNSLSIVAKFYCRWCGIMHCDVSWCNVNYVMWWYVKYHGVWLEMCCYVTWRVVMYCDVMRCDVIDAMWRHVTWRYAALRTVMWRYMIRFDATLIRRYVLCAICRNKTSKLFCDNITSTRNCSTGFGESDKTPWIQQHYNRGSGITRRK